MSATNPTIERLRTLPARLQELVIGQETAVATVCERLQHGELGLTTPGRPKASFLFLGPTGVGKTELSLQFTHDLLGPNKFVRLDMSEYQTKESVVLLLGKSAKKQGRIAEGHDTCGGIGTLLFDEIEKAHREVLDVLLQLLDAGRLTTGANRVLDFSRWYIVLTSNIGAQRIMAMRKSKYETMERLVRQDAQRELRPEILGRITASIVFDKLGYDIQCRIAEGMVQRELSSHRARGYLMNAGAGVLEAIIQRGYNDRLGARPMRDAVELLVRNALSENLLNGGRGIGELRGHPTGTKLELLPTATAAAA
ncbi:AAA family ATPase [Opitutus terrae]|uniref:ATPase AAA-2 domain protein n=1 Tax=Opitutus terrae (strain DSM 11246 / JCM 15787 / PB90-1) TaxID=452637 RepID=B1ZQ48_OPITP|nr:AAA family ATPase [Opitutus terrae]ACB77767.1 ATPase AAA-2 domain protein [Opitutus terrae PB90-1]